MAKGVTKLTGHVLRRPAHAAREQDDHDGAREAFEGALDRGLLDLPHGPTWMASLAWAADICAWLEDRLAAARLHDQLAPFASVMTCQYGPVGSARRPPLLRTLGRPDQAEQRLREAMALCERMDAQPFSPWRATTSASCSFPRPRAAALSTMCAPPPTSSA